MPPTVAAGHPVPNTLRASLRRNLVLVAAACAAALVALWLVRVNQVVTAVEHPAMTSGSMFTIQQGESEPVRITISPARRAEGASVELNGNAVSHPGGAEPGQLLVDLSKVAPGASELVIRVPRPTWFEAVTTVEIRVDG